MALDDETKGRIFGMFKKNVPTRVIVEETGVSKSTVNAMRKAWKSTPAQAGAHARDKVEAPTKKSTKKSVESVATKSVDDQEVTKGEMAKLAKTNLSFIVDHAKEGFSRAVLCEDPDKRTWMETQYLKVLHQAAVQLGKWGGLDSTTDKDNPILAEYAKALEGVKDKKVEDWEVTE